MVLFQELYQVYVKLGQIDKCSDVAVPTALETVMLQDPNMGHYVISILLKRKISANLRASLHMIYLSALSILVGHLTEDVAACSTTHRILDLLSKHDGVVLESESHMLDSILEQMNALLQTERRFFTADEIYMALSGNESTDLLNKFTESQWKYKRKIFAQQYRASAAKHESLIEEYFFLHILHDSDRAGAWQHLYRLMVEKQQHFLDMAVVRMIG